MMPILAAVSILAWLLHTAHGTDFRRDFDVTWGGDRARIFGGSESGEVLGLSLDSYSGSGFQSKSTFMFGRFDMQLKLVPRNSAGTVTSYYLKSEGSAWDEIDFEFLGNVTGQPYVVHTNVYTQGRGDREQQFYLWFDPTLDFHTYSILWNPRNVILYVDNVPIREFKNMESKGVAFPSRQPMRLFMSIYNADQWATRGGLVKTDWSMAPFTASYRGFNANGACIWWPSTRSSSCGLGSAPWLKVNQLDQKGMEKMRGVQRSFRIYDYCADGKRFPGGLPPECKLAR